MRSKEKVRLLSSTPRAHNSRRIAAPSLRAASVALATLLSALLASSCESGEVETSSTATKPSAPPEKPATTEKTVAEKAATASPAAAGKAQLPAPADVAASPATAERTPSGLASVVLQPGQGSEKPTLRDQVKVHYSGWTADGKMFDSSVIRNQPAEFGVTQVIKGWTEGLQLMTVGEKRRFWIPANLAYGENPRPGAPQGQLTFDVELLEILKAPEPPAVPKDVAAAPSSAKKTASGLRYQVLANGTGKDHPAPTNRVKVNYSGWTTDGKMFDSSVTRGRPATFGVGQVIKGWTEGLQLMVVGDKTRFWIPADLAYGENPRPGAPAGTLVFDVELLEIL